MPTYEEHRVALLPSWMRSDTDVAFQEVIGAEQDDLVDRAKQAVKVRFIGECPADALAGHGVDSQIERGPSETDTQYRARLLGRWETHPWRGLETSILAALALYGLANVLMFTRRDGYDDGNAHWWSRFWLVIDQIHDYKAWAFGAPLPFGSGIMFGSTMQVDELKTLRRVVRSTRCGSEVGVEFNVIYSGWIFNPAAEFGGSLEFGATTCRLPDGQFFNYTGWKTFGPGKSFGTLGS